MSKEDRCFECRMAFADYDRKVQVLVDGQPRYFHPVCFERERGRRIQQAPPDAPKAEGSRMSRERKRR